MLNGGELDGVRLLGRKTVDHMTRDHLPPDLSVRWGSARNPSQGFGLGFAVNRNAALNGEVGSDGTFSWGGAASTVFWIDPDEDVVAILLTQFMPSGRYPLGSEFGALTYQAIVD